MLAAPPRKRQVLIDSHEVVEFHQSENEIILFAQPWPGPPYVDRSYLVNNVFRRVRAFQ